MNRFWFYYVFFIGLLLSCEAEKIEPQMGRVKTVEGATTTYSVEYDGHGRVRKVGSRSFYYGGDGKVAFSRIATEFKDTYREEKYVERFSYHWDIYGRLKEVYLDSLYQKSSYHSPEDSHLTNASESMSGNVLLATYTYEGARRRPSEIRYRKITRSGLDRIFSIGMEEEMHYDYEDNNVTASRLSGYMSSPLLPNTPYPSTTAYTLDISYAYLPNPHYLSQVYEQLGFHPFDLSQVISKNSVASYQMKINVEGNGEEMNIPDSGDIVFHDYLGDENVPKTTEIIVPNDGVFRYKYRFNAQGWPLEIRQEHSPLVQLIKVTYE